MNSVEANLRGVLAAPAVALVLAVGVGCASSSQMSGSAVAPRGVDLTGSWVFNEEESDAARELMPGQQGGERSMPGGSAEGRRPGGAGGMPRRGRGAPAGGRIDPEKMRQTMQLAMDPKRRFSIEQSDSSIRISTAWREPIEFRFDGSKLKRDYDWGELHVKSGWVDRGLVVEWDIDGGGKVVERYSLSTTTDQLFVVTRVELGREPIEFRRVYDPAKPRLPDM